MSAADNKRLVRRYFDAMQSGDPSLPDLLDDDVTWWAPPNSKPGGLHNGKAAVLDLMASGSRIYETHHPVEVGLDRMIAEDDWVSVQLTRDARTRYHFAFRVQDGRICEVREHLDTLYSQQKLF